MTGPDFVSFIRFVSQNTCETGAKGGDNSSGKKGKKEGGKKCKIIENNIF